jgi:hypothetical protein
MLHQIEKLITEIGSKPSWGTKELMPKIQSASQLIEDQLQTEGKIVSIISRKKNKVKAIKKYDVLYLPLIGIPHYFLVHKIETDIVYGVIFTSTNKPEHFLCEVVEDRILEGSFVTTAYLSVSLDEALESFIRVYESKKEADEIFTKIKLHYKTLFNLK